MDIEDMLAVNYHVAKGTLNIDTGAFYDKWSFIWGGSVVFASVSRFNDQVHILSDAEEEVSSAILEFINIEKESDITDEDQESWD